MGNKIDKKREIRERKTGRQRKAVTEGRGRESRNCYQAESGFFGLAINAKRDWELREEIISFLMSFISEKGL